MEQKGFFEVLFDMSFTEFVTTRLIKVIFVIGIIGAGLLTLVLLAGGFRAGFGKGVLMLILSPVIFLLYTLLVRVWCEMIIAIFRVAENTGRLVELQTPKAS